MSGWLGCVRINKTEALMQVFFLNTKKSIFFHQKNASKEALEFANAYFVLSSDNRSVIQHMKRSSVLNNKETWVQSGLDCLIF